MLHGDKLEGVQGILQLFLEISAMVKKDEDIFADHVQPLRTYGWLLSQDQQKLVTKWVQKAIQVEQKLLSIQDSKKASASSGKGSEEKVTGQGSSKSESSEPSALSIPGEALRSSLLVSSGEASSSSSAKKKAKTVAGASIMHFFAKTK